MNSLTSEQKTYSKEEIEIITRYDNIITQLHTIANQKGLSASNDEMIDAMSSYEGHLIYAAINTLEQRRLMAQLLVDDMLYEQCENELKFVEIFGEEELFPTKKINKLYEIARLNWVCSEFNQFSGLVSLERFFVAYKRSLFKDEGSQDALYNKLKFALDESMAHSTEKIDETNEWKDLYIGMMSGKTNDRGTFAKKVFHLLHDVIYI